MKRIPAGMIILHMIFMASISIVLFVSAANPDSGLVQWLANSIASFFEEESQPLIVAAVFFWIAISFSAVLIGLLIPSIIVFKRGRPSIAYGIIITIFFMGINLGMFGGIAYIVWRDLDRRIAREEARKHEENRNN